MSSGLSGYLDCGSGEEEPVCRVWRIQVVLHERGSVGSIDQQHVVQTPAGLITFRALGGLLSPSETSGFGLGLMWQREQVDDGAAVGRGSEGRGTIQLSLGLCVVVFNIIIVCVSVLKSFRNSQMWRDTAGVDWMISGWSMSWCPHRHEASHALTSA